MLPKGVTVSNYYDILGITKEASDAEIKKAFRKQAMKYHPDQNQGDKAAEDKFKQVNEAYAVLSDQQKRQQYDTFGEAGFHQRYSSDDIFRGTDFGSIFNEMGFNDGASFFSSFFGGAQGGQGGFQQARKGQDVEYPLQIGFMDSLNGAKRKISFTLSNGQTRDLTVNIPSGINAGAKLRVQGKGAASPHGGSPGDLYILIEIASHPDFSRNGNDIESPILLKLSEAILGCSAEVKTPFGEKRVKIPPGVKHGTKVRLRGLGFPVSGNASAKGDLFAVVELDMPRHLDEDQLAAVTSLQESGL
tara:strand:+ start:308 stop:1216 length:909 start_codon:yes stop_codon:yes gene_type:complete